MKVISDRSIQLNVFAEFILLNVFHQTHGAKVYPQSYPHYQDVD